MAGIIFIGDELTAAGFRLTGIETIVPAHADAGAAFADARSRAMLVVVVAETAQRIPAPELEAALLAETPVVAIIPDVLMQAQPPDLARRLRGALGIES